MVSDLTRLRVYERGGHTPVYAKRFRAAVSMHCHTIYPALRADGQTRSRR